MWKLDWFNYLTLAVLVVVIIGRTLLMDRSPIPETSGKVYKIASASEFDALLARTTNIVVDFYADWCPPCRAIAPTFSKLADDNAEDGKLAFAKVNVDHVKDIAGRYDVSAMPTFVFFQNGKPKGLAAEGLRGSQSLKFNEDGLVDRIRGADRAALVALVAILAGKGATASGAQPSPRAKAE